MADWKNKPLVGVVAGVVFILAMIVMVVLLKPKVPSVTGTGTVKPPVTTPYVK